MSSIWREVGSRGSNKLSRFIFYNRGKYSIPAPSSSSVPICHRKAIYSEFWGFQGLSQPKIFLFYLREPQVLPVGWKYPSAKLDGLHPGLVSTVWALRPFSNSILQRNLNFVSLDPARVKVSASRWTLDKNLFKDFLMCHFRLLIYPLTLRCLWNYSWSILVAIQSFRYMFRVIECPKVGSACSEESKSVLNSASLSLVCDLLLKHLNHTSRPGLSLSSSSGSDRDSRGRGLSSCRPKALPTYWPLSFLLLNPLGRKSLWSSSSHLQFLLAAFLTFRISPKTESTTPGREPRFSD